MHSLPVLQQQTHHSSTDIILDTVEARRFDSSIYPICSLKTGKYLLFKPQISTEA